MLSTLSRHLKGLYEFHLLNPALCGLNWIGAGAAAFLAAPHNPKALLALLAFVGLCGVYTLFRLILALDQRIEAASPEPWVVEVNGVPVGTLSDARVALIEREVALDARLYLKQVANAARGLFHAASSLVTIIPMMCFWLALTLVILEPERARAALAAAANATPDQLRAGVFQLGQLIGFIAVGSVGIIIIATSTRKGNVLGFENQFSLALVEQVRRAVECAAKGEVLLTRRGVDLLRA